MKILVMQLARFGDIFQTWPVVKSLKRNYPNAELHFLCRKTFSGAISPVNCLDKILQLDVEDNINFILESTSNEPDTSKITNYLDGLKDEKYYQIINLSYSPLSSYITSYISDEKTDVRGFTRHEDGALDIPDDPSALIYGQLGVYKFNRIHLTRLFSAVAGVDLLEEDWGVSEAILAEGALRITNLPKRYLSVHIGGSTSEKLLFAEQWSEILNKLAKSNPELSFVLLGSSAEKEFSNKIINRFEKAYRFRENAATGYDVKDLELPDAEDLPSIIVSGRFHDIYLKYTNGEYLDDNEKEVIISFLSLLENEIYRAEKKGRFILNSDSFDFFDQLIPTRIDLKHLENIKSNKIVISKLVEDSKNRELKDAIFIDDDGKKVQDDLILTNREVEKMSKSKYNVVNPDAICEEYGADSLRMYEMFLGPLEQSKPWNTAGITGVHSFLKKLWRLYHTGANDEFTVTDSPSSGGGKGEDPSAENLRTLHKTIKKVEEDIENFSFNTSVSTFMICVNELTAQKCTSRAILEPLAILVSPYAPHVAEELWEKLWHSESISEVPFPKFEEKYLVESSKEYPISFNGKMRFTLELPLDMAKDEIESTVMAHEKTQQQLQGRTPKKVIVVPGKIVNIVG